MKLLRREWRRQWCRQHPASRKAWRQSERDRWAAMGLAGAGAWHGGPAAQAGVLGGGTGRGGSLSAAEEGQSQWRAGPSHWHWHAC